MPDEITAKIEDLATRGIAESEGDGHRVKAQPLPDLIEAAKFVAANTGMANKNRGLRFTRLAPPGAD